MRERERKRFWITVLTTDIRLSLMTAIVAAVTRNFLEPRDSRDLLFAHSIRHVLGRLLRFAINLTESHLCENCM